MTKARKSKKIVEKIDEDPGAQESSGKSTNWILIPKATEYIRSRLVRLGFVIPEEVSQKFEKEEMRKWLEMFVLTSSTADPFDNCMQAGLPDGWQYQEMDGKPPGIEITDKHRRGRVYVTPGRIVIRPYYTIVLVELGDRRSGSLYCVAQSPDGKDVGGTRSAVIHNPLRRLGVILTVPQFKESIRHYSQCLQQIFEETGERLERKRDKVNDPTAYWDEVEE